MTIYKVPYEIMIQQLQQMSKEEIERHLQLLGCTWSYEEICKKLGLTFNDLQIADEIFEKCLIDDKNSPYSKTFIDEAILEIVSRETFPFIHYGSILKSLQEHVEIENSEVKVDTMEQDFRNLLKLANYFHINSIENMMYQVNDGVDIYSLLAEMLDAMQIIARNNKDQAHKIVRFINKFLQVFTNISPFAYTMLKYEQAQAYIALHSTKGDDIFKQLLKTQSDVTDVVLHYCLAYLDDNKKKVKQIYQKYRNLLDKNSDSYSILLEVMDDIDKECI